MMLLYIFIYLVVILFSIQSDILKNHRQNNNLIIFNYLTQCYSEWSIASIPPNTQHSQLSLPKRYDTNYYPKTKQPANTTHILNDFVCLFATIVALLHALFNLTLYIHVYDTTQYRRAPSST